MENVWDTTEIMKMNVPSVDGEYLEAEVIEDGERDGREERRSLRFIRPLTLFFAAIFVVSMLGGYVGGGAMYTTVEAIDSLVAFVAGGADEGEAQADMATAAPLGTTVLSDDGLRIRCAGSFVKPGKGKNSEPRIMVALELQNVGDEKMVLRKSQFTALGPDGRIVEPFDQELSRGDNDAFYQFTSAVVEPGDTYTVLASFYKASNPVQMVYEPYAGNRAKNGRSQLFEICGERETLLA